MQKECHTCGYQQVEVAEKGFTFPMLVMYPTSILETEERVGPYVLKAAKHAPVSEGEHPLAIISHGTGGTPYVYRTLARYLARCGFVVGLPEHPFNNLTDNSLEGTVENLENRPKQLSAAIDWFMNSEEFASHVRQKDAAIIGHSMGAYTALAAAGGRPVSLPRESSDGNSCNVKVEPDSRIGRLVLLAPASVWFKEKGALDEVTVPVLMLTGEKDEITTSFHSDIILNGLSGPNQMQHRMIENGGHFSFLSPFPEKLVRPDFPPSQDPPGFDRASFHQQLNKEIAEFLSE
ncbi:alpha/beta hydrolase [Halobacillus salinarum]|uniref:Alpha/beta hydrolase n=1 Tax=Halobacillus salinarum TaxID=2932257 RepID=A0ABY4ENP2_9BACI|nr:alpha/beta fold hydrolase [Halobacillus salinarum]UOQ45814.1 alpha/beta hydrolase [Halobacillus salinarum]